MTLPLGAAGDLIRFDTALLVLVTAAVVVLSKVVADLRAELRALQSSAAVPRPAAFAAPPPPREQELTPEEFVAVIAAVHFFLGDRQRIVSITPAEPLWSREGRRMIFGSHSLR
ncbi:MAG: hypothetical protein SFU53_05370 [Terrimicrobiaceae bacterium]|nr:hypothetical protein [Terrimicrobiaceae bacterium]